MRRPLTDSRTLDILGEKLEGLQVGFIRITVPDDILALIDEEVGGTRQGRSGAGRAGLVTRLLYEHYGRTPPDVHGERSATWSGNPSPLGARGGAASAFIPGATLKAARERAGLSQGELGAKMGVSASAVSHLEKRGVRSALNEERVRAALGEHLE